MSKKLRPSEPEIPITPMLDMAFQLLTFFILTYRPAPTEGQFSMNLLPAQPATSMEAPAPTEANAPSDLPAGLRTLPTTLRATADGAIAAITIGDNQVSGLDELSKSLAEILADPTLPFDQALIKVDPRLKYADLIRVVDVFARNKLTKISFAELGADDMGAAP
ncbi:MAG: biopolymer transporter ExbD [Isosphaeraceae bacterium]|nr:biopolymer transporter ExbD [Isosphaeraceae bacterium]